MKIKGILINVEKNYAELIEIDDTLESYYKTLNCDIIDIVSRTIGGKRFDIICDEEGLFKENPKISALDEELKPMLVGNIFICKHNGKGKEISLKDEDIKHIEKHLKDITTYVYTKPYTVITSVGY